MPDSKEWKPNGANDMQIETTRFGPVEVDESRLIEIPAGLLGFSSFKTFSLLQPDENGVFFWLQSVETPDLAFVVTDPALWVPDFQATIRKEQMEELEEEYGLDKAMPVAYLQWLGALPREVKLSKGEFGEIGDGNIGGGGEDPDNTAILVLRGDGRLVEVK